MSNAILQAGTLVGARVATTTVFLDDAVAPVLNLQHQYVGGSINLSAGTNPAQGFNINPVALGNSQIMSGPNLLISNTLSAPGTFSVGTANVANALNVTGPSVLTGNVTMTGNVLISGPLVSNGSALVSNSLTVGNTIFVPTIKANAATLSGPMANLFIETRSNTASTTAAVYLSPEWRIKELTNGGLAHQYYSAALGGWVNASVIAPPGISITIANLTAPTT